MYHFDFDEIIDRQHTSALSTDGFRGYIFHAGPEKVFPYKDDEFVRMWVADMDFGVAPEILDEMRKRIDRRIFGYTGVYDHDYGNRHFRAAGHCVSTAGIQEKALRKYIQEQEKQDRIEDKVSTKEYEDPFKGQAR